MGSNKRACGWTRLGAGEAPPRLVRPIEALRRGRLVLGRLAFVTAVGLAPVCVTVAGAVGVGVGNALPELSVRAASKATAIANTIRPTATQLIVRFCLTGVGGLCSKSDAMLLNLLWK